jgi:pimeloyl-ACP methyl ester carboxylesterase
MLELTEPRERFVDGVFVREWGDADAPGVLLWPGLGFTSAYFYGIADALPGRAVALDPPGFGRSPELGWDEYEFPSLARLAASLLEATGCVAFVGHSIGANVALALGAASPPGLRCIVLVDGGYLEREARTQLGAAVHADRESALEWARTNMDEWETWDEAFEELRGYFENWTQATELAARDALREEDGRIREAGSPDAAAASIFAMNSYRPVEIARSLGVPALLVASGRERGRDVREPQWTHFTAASSLVGLYVADDWGHHPFQQAPEESGRIVGDWLRDHL